MSSLTDLLAPLDEQKEKPSLSPLPMKPANICFCAKKGQGKTTVILNLLMNKASPYHKAFDKIYLISPTAMRDDKYKDLLDDIGDQYYTDLNNDVVEEIIERMDAYRDELESKKKKSKPHFLIIFDDCIHAMRGKKSRAMDRLATQNRHLQVSNWYATQKWNSYLPTLVRSNLDCIGFWRTGNRKELDSFIEEQNEDEDVLRALYEYATKEPYSFLWINQYHGKPMYFKKFDRIEFRKKYLD
jgi:hypothetical protein